MKRTMASATPRTEAMLMNTVRNFSPIFSRSHISTLES